MAFKKMTLIDPNELEKLRKRTIFKETSVAAVEDLDEVMREILSNKTLTVQEKVRDYNEALSKYRLFYDKAIKRKKIEADQSITGKKTAEEQALESVSQNNQKKAAALLESMKRHPQLSWSDSGEIFYENRPLTGVNLLDFVNDAVKLKKTSSDYQGLLWALHQVNFPKSFINNTEMKKILASYETPMKQVDTKQDSKSTETPKRRRGRKRTQPNFTQWSKY